MEIEQTTQPCEFLPVVDPLLRCSLEEITELGEFPFLGNRGWKGEEEIEEIHSLPHGLSVHLVIQPGGLGRLRVA